MARLDVAAVVTRHLGDGLCEVVPGTDTLVAVMVDAFVAHEPAVRDDVLDRVRQVLRVGRRACLVEHHLQHRLRCRQVQHGLDEVPAIFGIEPCRAENQSLAATIGYGLFSV